MALDKSKFPPGFPSWIVEMLEKLEAQGVDVQNLGNLPKNRPPSSAPSGKPEDCDCPACTLRKKIEARGGVLTPGLLQVLDTQAQKMADKLVTSVQAMVEPLRNELSRQVEINDANIARIGQLKDDVALLSQRYSQLEESHRKQVGLLHKRVTKRKGEVADVKVRVATTRGRVTRVEKKLT